jgi:hypothetical protein
MNPLIKTFPLNLPSPPHPRCFNHWINPKNTTRTIIINLIIRTARRCVIVLTLQYCGLSGHSFCFTFSFPPRSNVLFFQSVPPPPLFSNVWLVFPRLYRCRVIWLLPHPLSPPNTVSKHARRHTGRLRKRDNVLTGEEGGGGAKSYDGEKFWSSESPRLPYFLTPGYYMNPAINCNK